MPSRALPNLGLKAFFIAGEDGWGNDIDQNFLKLSTLVQAGVISMVTSLPTVPQQGDVYLVSGAASTNANRIALYDGASWKFYTASEGWTIFNRATDSYQVFDGANWQAMPLANLLALSGREVGVGTATSLIDRTAGDNRYATIDHIHPATVSSFNTRTGDVVLTLADIADTGFMGTVETVAGRTGEITLTSADLTDFPSTNGDFARHTIRYNEAGNAIEAKAYEQQDIFPLVGGFTLNALHAGRYIRIDAADPTTITVPLGVLPVGTKITIAQGGAGAITIAAATDVEIGFLATNLAQTSGQHAVVTLVQYDTNKWDLYGNLAAA